MDHGIEFNDVGLLTNDEIKELFPNRIGDRVKFKKSVKKVMEKATEVVRPRAKSTHKTKTQKKKLKQKEKIPIAHDIHCLLKDETRKIMLVEGLLDIYTNFNQHLFEQKRRSMPDWQPVEFENATIFCPFCDTPFTPLIRKDSPKQLWNYTSIRRHLKLLHPDLKANPTVNNTRNCQILLHRMDGTSESTAHHQEDSLDTEVATIGSVTLKDGQLEKLIERTELEIGAEAITHIVATSESSATCGIDAVYMEEINAIETDKEKVQSFNDDNISEGSKLMIDNENSSELNGRVLTVKQTHLGSNDKDELEMPSELISTSVSSYSWQVGEPERVQEEQFNTATELDTVIENGDVEMISIAQSKSTDALQKVNSGAVSQCYELMNDDEKSSEMNGTCDQNVNDIVDAIDLSEKPENQIEFHVSNPIQCENAEVSMQIDLETSIESDKTVDVLQKSDKTEVVPELVPEEEPAQEEQPAQDELPDWKKPGVEFGWAKSSAKSKFVPGFILNNGECQWITTKSEVSSRTFVVQEFKRNISNDKNKKIKMKYVKKFNQLNGTHYK